jgi:hypothetical protein
MNIPGRLLVPEKSQEEEEAKEGIILRIMLEIFFSLDRYIDNKTVILIMENCG